MKSHTHYCRVCGRPFHCEGVGKGRFCEVDKAASANGDGPYCQLHYHLEMARRHAAHDGIALKIEDGSLVRSATPG